MASATALPAADPQPGTRRTVLIIRLLALIALLALGASYSAPSWWVALKAPNYPAQTFPDGVRIHFHVDGVRNGCVLRQSSEVLEKEALDCVHEMDTINHFVGMYPIASGGPVEKLFSPFLFSLIGVVIVGFVAPGRRVRLAVMGLGCAGIAAWMSLALYAPDGVQYMGRGWVQALVDSLGRADDENTADRDLHPVVRQLKESLARSGIGTDSAAPPKAGHGADKAQLIAVLKAVHDAKAPVSLTDPTPSWSGRGLDVMAWHYKESLGRWFNEPAKNDRLVRIMVTSAHALYGVVLAAMVVLLWIASRPRSVLFLALPAIPIILPVGFVVEYSAWLWWYGHSLNAMGAFTLKPFMPTVFGDGKVAQFSTHSYPASGFALMCVVALCMALATLLRRRLPDAARD